MVEIVEEVVDGKTVITPKVREELRGLMDIELCTLGDDTVSDALHEEAIARGVDLIGGAPHLADDPSAELDRLLTLAERLGCGVDMHTDESLDGPLTILQLAERTARSGSLERLRVGGCPSSGARRLPRALAVGP